MSKPGAGKPPGLLKILGGAPSTDKVLDQIVAKLGILDMAPSRVAEGLDGILEKMMQEGLKLLQEWQSEAAVGIVNLFQTIRRTDSESAFRTVMYGFTSLSNQRKKRAGVHLEKCMQFLLHHCGIPWEIGTIVTGQSDLVVPSMALFKTHPERVVVLEFKRTLRERWKEVRDEITRSGQRVWLITLDDYLAKANLGLIGDAKITLYLPHAVYEKHSKSSPIAQTRSLKTLIADLRAFSNSP